MQAFPSSVARSMLTGAKTRAHALPFLVPYHPSLFGTAENFVTEFRYTAPPITVTFLLRKFPPGANRRYSEPSCHGHKNKGFPMESRTCTVHRAAGTPVCCSIR